MTAGGQGPRFGWPWPSRLTKSADALGPSSFVLSGPGAIRPAAAARTAQEPAAQNPAFLGGDAIPDIVVGTGRGDGFVRVLSGVDGREIISGRPFGPTFNGGVRVAAGDVNADGVPDVIVGQGLGGAQVRIFSGANGADIASFTAFVNFTGGVYVAGGDVNGDGHADVIVGAGAGGGVVRVFSGVDRREIASGYPFGTGFAGGVSVAVGDVNGDGQLDYVTGMALGGLVRVFDGATLGVLAQGFPFGPFYFGGVAVAAGDMNGDGRSEVTVGAQLDIRPPVRVYDIVTGGLHASFPPHPESLGANVAAGDLNGDGYWELLTGAGLGGLPEVRVFNGQTHAEMLRGLVFPPGFSGGVFLTTTASGLPNLRFTSPTTATFTAGTAGSFTITTSGAINPQIRLVGGTLPTGLTFTDNGNGTATVAGVAGAGTGGVYTLQFRGGFGVGIPYTLTLTVREAPSITSPNATFMVANAPASFTVTTTGFPARTLSVSGLLPPGVTFVDNGNSTATLAGTPALGSSGVYPLIITAANGVTPDATQNFTLTVHNPPSITSVATATFTAGIANSFLVTTSAFPTATVLTSTGALPGGVTFTNNGDGTATLSGNPATGTAGDYALQLSASNGIGSPAAQNFTLTVIPNPTPIFTSAASTVFTVNTGGSFTVTTSAFPAVTSIVNVGALPPGVTYTDNGNGTATLAGTPQLGSDGDYPLQFTADNGAATATQNFTLTVNPPAGGLPVITSANGATFVVGAAGTFLVTTTATPAVTTIVATGALPGGVTFTNNADGTATLSGTAAAGTAGIYPLTIDATNTNGTASQAFTLTVNNETSVPVFTSATTTTFTIGTAGTFQITTAANPDVTTITLTGTPPTGVNFLDNGNGTATLSGTPTAGAGLNSLIFSASNGIGAPVTQNFSLNVQQPAAVTSAASTNFDAGVAATFTVTTVGTPVPALGFTGSLPSGVTFVDQGNGTAVISGLAPIGTASPYPITITATNAVGVPGTQNFTLNVIGNNPPTLDPIASPPAIDEDAAQQTVNLSGISAGFNETQTLQVTASSSNTGVVPNPAVTYISPAATGSLAYTPVPGASGTATITVTVIDTGLNGVFGGGDDGTATQTFQVTVNAVLDPPTLDAIANASIPEDSATQTVSLTGISAGVGETQDLQVTAASNNTGLIPNPAVTYTSPNAAGSLDYTPVVNQSGSADITVTVRDAGPNLALGDGDDQFFTRTFTVTVGGVNDLPVAVGDGYTVAEGGTLNVVAPGVLVNDSDIDGPGLNAVLIGGPSNASSFTLNADGSFSYTHNGSETTTDSFTYRANDTLVDSNTVTVTITISPVNDGPVIDLDQDDSGTTAGNYAGTFTEGDPSPALLADTDAIITDAEQTTLDSLTVTITNLLDAGFETLSADTTGTSLVASYDTGTPGIGILTISGAAQPIADYITVLKTVGYSNTDENPDATQRTVTFVGHDGIGSGPAATTLVTVTPVNDPPTADDETYSLTPGGTLTIPAPGVLDGDTDLEGATLTAVLGSSPADAASFTLNPDGSFTYQHNGIGTSDVTFTYQANDGAGANNLSNVATVTIDINSPPVAADDSYNTDEETTLTEAAPTGVLSNDSAGDAGDTVTVAAVNGSGASVGVQITTAQGALLTLNADGSFFYDPTGVAAFQQLGAGQSLIDSVDYTAQDLGGLQDIGTLTITVNGVNDTPVLTASAGATAFTEDGGPVVVDGGITLTDTDTVPIASATVTISNLLNAGLETLALGSAPPAGVTANFVAPTLTISGNATVAEYQTMLRSVTYNNTSQNPDATARTINFQVNDGTVNSGVAGKTVTVASVNDAPIVTGAGNTLAYTEGNAATVIEAALAITDADHTQLTGATVQISANFAAGQDVLSFTPVGAITGAFVGDTLTLTGPDSLANYELALESVRYFNSSVTPSELQRTATWVVTDGTTPSTPVFSTITVTAVNSAPVVVGETFQTIGNTELRVDMVAGTTPHASETTSLPSAAEGVLDNDSDPEGDPIAVTAITGCADGDGLAPFDCTLADGAVIHVEANGEFSFTPGPGATSGSFTYTVTDAPAPGQGSPLSVTGTVTFTILERVWYVKNDGAAGNGTSISPLNSLTSLNGAGGAGDPDDGEDYIFVYYGDGTGTGLSGGLELETRQRLLGEFIGLSVPVDLNGEGSPTILVSAPGGTACSGGPCRPLMSPAAGNAVTATDPLPQEITGFRLAGGATGNAIEVTTDGDLIAGSSLLIQQNVFEGAGAEGIEVNHNLGSSNTFSLAVVNNTWNAAGTHTGNAIDIVRQAGATGSLVIAINSNNNILSTGVAGQAININGQSVGQTFLGFFANNTVHPNSMGGVNISNVTFDASPGGGFDTVNAQALTIAVDGDPVTNAGLTLTTVDGSLSFTDLDVYGGSAGLTVTGTGPTLMSLSVTPNTSGGTSVIKSSSGAAVTATSATLDLRLNQLASTTSGVGVSLTTVAGQFSAPASATIVKSSGSGAAFTIDNSAAGTTALTSTYAGTITNTSGSGRSVSVNTADAGSSASFTGAITDTGGMGISLTSNTGATLSFSGGLTLNGAGSVFAATGGGTLNVTGTNTIGATSAATTTALTINTTTIGGSGVTFRSISATGAATGISLNTTGAGSFTVTGVGSGDGTGGTIQNSTSRGGEFISATNVSLSNMNFTGNGVGGNDVNCGDALGASTTTSFVTSASCESNIHLQTVTGVTLNNVSANDGDAHGINGVAVSGLTMTNVEALRNGDMVGEDGVQLVNLSGTVSVTGSTFRDNASRSFEVQNNTGTPSITFNSDFFGNTNFPTAAGAAPSPSNSTANGALLLATNGTNNASITSVTTNSTFDKIYSIAFFVDMAGNTSQNVTFGQVGQGNTITTASQGVSIVGTNSGGLTASVFGNTINNDETLMDTFASTNINVRRGGGVTPASGNWNATIDSNNVGISGNTKSGCEIAGCHGISTDDQGSPSGTFTVVIQNNSIFNVSGGINVGSANAGAHTIRASILNNTVQEPDTTPQGGSGMSEGNGIFVFSGTSFDGTTFARIEGNNVDGGWAQAINGDAIRIRHQGAAASQFFVCNIAPSPANAAQTAAFLIAQNPATSDADGAGGTFDAAGAGFTLGYTVSNACPLLLSGGGGEGASAGPVPLASQADVHRLAAAARARWAARGLTAAERAALRGVRFEVADLPAGYLAELAGDRIRIDPDASGAGWFVDSTPMDDAEFGATVPGGHRATDSPAAPAGIDLLTAIMHEIGHRLGFRDAHDAGSRADLMFESLTRGERRLPQAAVGRGQYSAGPQH